MAMAVNVVADALVILESEPIPLMTEKLANCGLETPEPHAPEFVLQVMIGTRFAVPP